MNLPVGPKLFGATHTHVIVNAPKKRRPVSPIPGRGPAREPEHWGWLAATRIKTVVLTTSFEPHLLETLDDIDACGPIALGVPASRPSKVSSANASTSCFSSFEVIDSKAEWAALVSAVPVLPSAALERAQRL